MSGKVTTDLLRRFPLFSGIEPSDLKDLAGLARVVGAARKECLFREGDPAEGFFLLLSGRIKLTKIGAAGREQILHFVGPGQSFAEAALYLGRAYPANAEALEDCEAVFIPRRGFASLLASSPSLALNLVAHLATYLHVLSRKVEELTLMDATARMSRFILDAMDPQTGLSRLPAAKGQTAASLGMAVETFSRTLARFKDEGWIKEASPGVLQVLDPEALRDFLKG